LDVEKHGRADNPTANWRVLNDIQNLDREGKEKIGGGKNKGGGPESRRSKDYTHGPR
jgi:hypothetical protein